MPIQPGAAPYAGQVPAAGNPSNGLAIGALVTGIIGLITFWTCGFGILLGIIGVVLGFLGRKKAQEMNGTGAGLALGGIITGGLAIIGGALFILTITVWGNSVSDDFGDINSDPSDGECDLDRFLQDPDC